MRIPWNAPIRANNETALTALIGKSHEPFNVNPHLVFYELSVSVRYHLRQNKVRCLSKRLSAVSEWEPRARNRGRVRRAASILPLLLLLAAAETARRYDEPRKRSIRQAGAGQMRLRRRRQVARGRRPSREAVARGRADTRTRGSVGVVGVGEASYATRRFAQARPTERSSLSTRESRNDHRSVRVGRRVGRPAPACASTFCRTGGCAVH